MNHLPHLLLAALLLLLSPLPVTAREVLLGAGEVYRDKELTVRCTEGKGAQPIVLSDCQFWDDFTKTCLYERKTHHLGKRQCVEECQHWDSFNNVCHYATQCQFFPEQRAFVRVSCETFDAFANVCRKSKQELLR